MPLVSRRWRQLADSPQLCRSLAVELKCSERLVHKLVSLSYWLLNSGAAAHVERLEVTMPVC